MKVSWVQGMVFMAVGILLGAVGLRPGEGSQGGQGSHSPPAVLAVVGDSAITEADVEAVRPGDFLRLRQQLHQFTSQVLESVIQSRLVRLEADARGVEPSDLLHGEVDARVEAPTAERISEFYQERGLQGSLESLTPQISAYLQDESRRGRFTAFMVELETRHGVERRIDPFRITVASEGFPSKGPRGAPVTLVEFSDFQCPYCRQLLATLQQVEEAYGDRVRFVFRHFPLASIHPQATVAAEASLCAHGQGKFWEMHAALFANPRALEPEQLKDTARQLGLNGRDFDQCLDSGRYGQAVAEDLAAGQAVGVQGTPALFINGRFVTGAKPFEEIAAIIDEELRRAAR